MTQLVQAAASDTKCALAALTAWSRQRDGGSHIHLRINALQMDNAFRAYVHEPWTRDLSERQALARIVERSATRRARR